LHGAGLQKGRAAWICPLGFLPALFGEVEATPQARFLRCLLDLKAGVKYELRHLLRLHRHHLGKHVGNLGQLERIVVYKDQESKDTWSALEMAMMFFGLGSQLICGTRKNSRRSAARSAARAGSSSPRLAIECRTPR